MIHLINSQNEYEEIKENQPEFYLLKHSLTCPVSSSALKEYEGFSDKTESPCYVLYVQEARALSTYIAEQTQIRHESPQAIYFKQGKAVWDASHYNIKAETLRNT
ncbi:bacillithiol system redox-active protein YtxJ [Halobacillus sp. A5]|uniref:bacillithiol system redox-active protein YtxJ n=1 Tax=Halobacillus sp. A5 TaxID=2880263 RepID=UPI0020A6C390|nr:bacillithiol system redox-active protein YtxJ [Halobacillus sp. A5]MCP3025352.1 bacillithiol system redox-active protein YtxJ [Halobacillus sp. A5]